MIGKYVRRHRVGVAAGSAAVLALAIGLGVALQQGQEARRQRVQAEGLIEFMLGDLRQKLSPVGRLDVLDAVGAKVLTYYAAQDPDVLDTTSLARRASALHLVGEMADKRGDLDEAARSFRQAADTTAVQLARAPQDAQRIFDQAQSEYWVGFIAWRRGEFPAAEASFGQYLALSQQLSRIDPANADWRTELAWAHQNLGVVYVNQARLPQALAAFEAARKSWDGVVAQRPSLWVEMGTTLGWLAVVHDAMGHYETAIDVEREKIAALLKMPEHTTNTQVLYLLANAQHMIGKRLFALGQVAPAAQALQDAVGRFSVLVARDPANTDWLMNLASSRLLAAEVAVTLRDSDAARTLLASVDEAISPLLAASPDKVALQVSMKGRWLYLRAHTSPEQADLVRELGEFLTAVPRFETAGKSLSADQGQVVSAVGLVLGDLLRGAGQAEAARRRWATALERLQAPAYRDDLPAKVLRASLLLRMGGLDEAQSLVESLQSSSYRHPDLADLRQRLARSGQAPTRP